MRVDISRDPKATHYCKYCGLTMKARDELMCRDRDGDFCEPKKRSPKNVTKRVLTRAAKALLEPSPEEMACRKLLAKNTECIIRIEKTLAMLVKAMGGNGVLTPGRTGEAVKPTPCSYCGAAYHQPYEDGLVECREALRARVLELEADLERAIAVACSVSNDAEAALREAGFEP